MDRRVFSCCLPFLKVSAKKIDYCGRKPGETHIAHMVSDYVSHALRPVCKNFVEKLKIVVKNSKKLNWSYGKITKISYQGRNSSYHHSTLQSFP